VEPNDNHIANHVPTPLKDRMTPAATARLQRYLLAGVRIQFPGRVVRIERVPESAQGEELTLPQPMREAEPL
jgi:hypothetical protein